MGCAHVLHDFAVKEIETEGSKGAGSDARQCVTGAAKAEADARAFDALGMRTEAEKASAQAEQAALEQAAEEQANYTVQIDSHVSVDMCVGAGKGADVSVGAGASACGRVQLRASTAVRVAFPAVQISPSLMTQAREKAAALAKLGIKAISPEKLAASKPTGFSEDEVERATAAALSAKTPAGNEPAEAAAEDTARGESDGVGAWAESFEAPECGWEDEGALGEEAAEAEGGTRGLSSEGAGAHEQEAPVQGATKEGEESQESRFKSRTLRKIFGRRMRERELPVQGAAAAALATEAAWYAEWRRRLSCWILALPRSPQEQLGNCIGALSLHLGSRLETLLGRGMPATAVQPAATEPGCEWLEHGTGRLRLPELPELGGFQFSLPPIPRLVPPPEQLLVLQRSLMDGESPSVVGEAEGNGYNTRASQQRGRALELEGASVGTIAGALVAASVLLTWRAAQQQRSGRPGLRRCPIH